MEFSNKEDFIHKCKEISNAGIDLYIVGAGEHGQELAKLLNENEIPVKKFIDKNGDGVSAIRYEECDNKNAFFIVSSFLYKKSMLDNLRDIVGVSETSSMATFDYHIKNNWGSICAPLSADEALDFLLKNFRFDSVLDIGCGQGLHSEIFLKNGKAVTAIDYGDSIYFKRRKKDSKISLIVEDINKFESTQQWDCVWCAHVLEHQLNPHNFLKKIHSLIKENGILAITVPPLEELIVGGYVSVWNAGLLLYHLVLAGFDCSNAHIKKYGYNLSVILEKHSINVLNNISYDAGDIKKIRKFLPSEIDFMEVENNDNHFWGNIECMNWNYRQDY